MARKIQFYRDSACTQLWANVPITEIVYDHIQGNGGRPSTVTIGENTFTAFDTNTPTTIMGVPEIKTTPFLSYEHVQERMTLYCKNGFSVRIEVTSQALTFDNMRVNGVELPFRNINRSIGTDLPRMWCIGFFDTETRKHYVGFTLDARTVWAGYITPTACIEDSFWENSFRPPYDYGTKPDGDGGQGDGTIPHEVIGFSSKPTISLPTGNHGLHAYRIDSFAYDDLQAYLWGQGSTLAKNLWQKFVNSKTNPSACVVACYRLPQIFMPSGTVTDGIKIAGVKMPRGAGIIQEVSLGFVDKFVYIGHVNAPFNSWADYCGASVLISIPACGEFTAPLEKVWDFDIFVKYRVDLSNGNIVGMACAGTWADNDGEQSTMNYLLGEMSGNVAYNVPISGGDDGTLARMGAVIGAVGNVVSGITNAVQSAITNDAGNGGTGMSGGASNGALMTSKSLHYMSDIVMPPFHTHVINANLSGNMSACSNGIAYVEYQIARFAYPSNYGDVMGYPARSSGGKLRNFQNGYGEFYVSANFDIHGATYEEKAEIVSLLESGVFV